MFARIKFGDGADGKAWDAASVKKLCELSNDASKVIAEKFGWSESGTDRFTGQRVNFAKFNAKQRANSSRNGPDAIYVIVGEDGVILHYLLVENKATTAPYVRPSRYSANSPFRAQMERLSKWGDPDYSGSAKHMLRSMDALERAMETGELSYSEYTEIMYYANVRVASSPGGGHSRAAKMQYENSETFYAGTDLEANMPEGGTNLYKISAPPGDDDKESGSLSTPAPEQ